MTAFIASVPFKTANRIPGDLPARPIVTGTTVGGRPFSLVCIDEAPYPYLLLVSPSATEGDPTIMLRCGLATLVGRLVETVTLGRLSDLDESVFAALDVLRGCLAVMDLETSEGTVNAMDLFGQTLDHMAMWAARWEAAQVDDPVSPDSPGGTVEP